MVKNSQSTQNNKFAISLQYLRKEVMNGVHFLHADKHQSWLYRFWGEWPSGLRRCYKNRKVPGSNPARRSAGLRDPTSLRGSR